VFCSLAALVIYMIRTEREWWGMMEGDWTGADHASHRKRWADTVSTLFKSLLFAAIPGMGEVEGHFNGIAPCTGPT
jgi:hypothetical protein